MCRLFSPLQKKLLTGLTFLLFLVPNTSLAQKHQQQAEKKEPELKRWTLGLANIGITSSDGLISLGLYGEYHLSKRSGINFSIDYDKYQPETNISQYSVLFSLRYNYYIAQGALCEKINYEWYAGAGISSGYDYVETEDVAFFHLNGGNLFKELYGDVFTGIRLSNKRGWGLGIEYNVPFKLTSEKLPHSKETAFKFSLFKKF